MTMPRFTSERHEPRTAALLGIALGVSFGVCFLTGLLSHFAYDQPSWLPIGPRPAGLYRFTQGLHVATGIASIPLLLVKLWVVYPHLWTRPPIRSVAHAAERLSLLPLVAGALFLLVSGSGNLARWRPWGFFFTDGHYHAAWITVGALIVHVTAKAAPTLDAITRRATPPDDAAVTRRALLTGVAAASATLTLATVGQTVRPLAAIAMLAPRDPRVGPQGLPVNKTAVGAGLATRLRDSLFAAEYRLEVVHRGASVASLDIDAIRSFPATEAVLPIACVEGWSADARWRGVAVRDLLAAHGIADANQVQVESLEERGRYRSSVLTRAWIDDRHTLLAYDLAGEALHIDHGWPLRLVAPNRPGVLQTKWVTRVVAAS